MLVFTLLIVALVACFTPLVALKELLSYVRLKRVLKELQTIEQHLKKQEVRIDRIQDDVTLYYNSVKVDSGNSLCDARHLIANIRVVMDDALDAVSRNKPNTAEQLLQLLKEEITLYQCIETIDVSDWYPACSLRADTFSQWVVRLHKNIQQVESALTAAKRNHYSCLVLHPYYM